MSPLERWVANTKRVLAKDKNTETEYEFESVFPDGAPDGTAFSAENMNKIIDAVNGLDESKAQPNGIATLNASGKLAQMPTAADVGALSISAITSGTNSRGTWMRYPNDLMICWGQATAASAGGNAHAGVMWTYPVPFTQTPIVIANAVLDSSAGAMAWVGGKTTTQAGLHVTNGSSVARDIPIDVIAVGVWR